MKTAKRPEKTADASTNAEYLTTRDMRSLLETGGKLRLGAKAIGKLARGEYGKEQPDVQWLYDCAMERGNSEGMFVGDPVKLRFTNAGTCTLGIVCDVLFCNTSLPARVLAKLSEGSSVWPEDMDGVEPAFVDITYDEFYDEEEEEEE